MYLCPVIEHRARAPQPAVGPQEARGTLSRASAPSPATGSAAAFAAPTQAQAQAWAAIGKGENTLVIAPTGSGKTLAAFLWALDRLATAPAPADPKLRCRVLYISPLKALAVDIERNLRAPLTGIRHTARPGRCPSPTSGSAVRTGDTAADERRRLASKPPDILITTPESLFLLLTSRARDALRGVDTVIVDEVHALAGQQARRAPGPVPGTAGRARTAGRAGPAQRIGLSATVRPAEEVAVVPGRGPAGDHRRPAQQQADRR